MANGKPNRDLFFQSKFLFSDPISQVVELQEELLKLKQEKSGISETGQSNTKPMRDRVGKRDVRERVGDQVLRRKDMSVKERVGEARRQQQAIQMRSNDGEDPQLAYCSDRFRQGLEESLEHQQGEHKSQGVGRNYNHPQDRGQNKRKFKSSHSQPIPEELVLTELTDAGPVKKENFAKFSDESSEEEEEDEEYGQPRKSMKRRW